MGRRTGAVRPCSTEPRRAAAARLQAAALRPLVTALPFVNALFGLVARDAIALLDLAGQHVALALNHIQIVVGELAPLLLDLPDQLLPVALDDVAIHACLLGVKRW